MDKLTETEILLYEDLCRACHETDDLLTISKRQIDILLSLTYNGIKPVQRNLDRAWRVQNKGKYGGYLWLQKIGRKFFSSEKS